MKKLLTAAVLAASLAPVVAQAADRPGAVSYAAPTNMGSGMRVGAATGRQSKEDGVVGTLLIAAVAFGAGYLTYDWTHHRHYRYYSPN